MLQYVYSHFSFKKNTRDETKRSDTFDKAVQYHGGIPVTMIVLSIPDALCMEYLPTFTPNMAQM